MRRIFAIGMLLLGFAAAAQETATSHPSVTAYLQTLLEKPVDTIILRIDQLIESVGQQQPDLQSKTAGIAFDFFSSSPVMGHEAVAVHIADNWFLNRRLALENETLYPVIYTYAEFNRSSLPGAAAPPLEMEDMAGMPISVRASESAGKILFSTTRNAAPAGKRHHCWRLCCRNIRENRSLSTPSIPRAIEKPGKATWQRPSVASKTPP